MASSQDSQTSDRWKDRFRNQQDIALRMNSMQELFADSLVADLFQPKSAQDVEAVGGPANDLVSGRSERSDIAAVVVTQHPELQAVQPFPAGTNVDPCEYDEIVVAKPAVPYIPALSVNHQQQSSDMIRSEAQPRWMGRACGLDGSVHITNAGVVPASRHHSPSNTQRPRTGRVSLPKENGHNPMLPALTQCNSMIGNTDITAVPASFSNSRISAGMQAPGGPKDLGSSKLSLGDWLQQTSELLLDPRATTSSSLRHAPPPFIMHQSLAPAQSSVSTLGTSPSASGTSTRSSTTRGGGHCRGSKDFPNYPSRSMSLPVELSRQQICRSYPNHLHGDTLLRVVYGRGGEQGVWSGKDIWDACPVNGRNYPANSRPHNYLEQRIRRAEIEALDASQAAPRPKKTKRNCGDATPDEYEGEQTNPPSKRIRPTHVSTDDLQLGPRSANILPNDPAQGFRVLQNMSNGRAKAEAARTMFQSPQNKASAQSYRDPRVKDVGLDPLVLTNRLSHVGIPAEAQAARLPTSAIDTINVVKEGPSMPQSCMYTFNAKVRAEIRFQHQILWDQLSLHPQASAWSDEAKRARIRRTWRNRYEQWEKSVELKYGIQTEKKPQGVIDPLGLLVKAYRKDTPPSALLGEQGHNQYMKDARDVSMQCLLDDMRRWRSDFAIMFADDLPVDGPMLASAVKQQDVPVINLTTRMSHGLAQLGEDKSVSSGSTQTVEPGSHCCAITASESQNAVDLTSYPRPVADLKESGPPFCIFALSSDCR